MSERLGQVKWAFLVGKLFNKMPITKDIVTFQDSSWDLGHPIYQYDLEIIVRSCWNTVPAVLCRIAPLKPSNDFPVHQTSIQRMTITQQYQLSIYCKGCNPTSIRGCHELLMEPTPQTPQFLPKIRTHIRRALGYCFWPIVPQHFIFFVIDEWV